MSIPPRVIRRPRKPLLAAINSLTIPNLEWHTQRHSPERCQDTSVRGINVASCRRSSNLNNSFQISPVGRHSESFHVNYRNTDIHDEKYSSKETGARKEVARSNGTKSPSFKDRQYNKNLDAKGRERKCSYSRDTDHINRNNNVNKSGFMQQKTGGRVFSRAWAKENEKRADRRGFSAGSKSPGPVAVRKMTKVGRVGQEENPQKKHQVKEKVIATQASSSSQTKQWPGLAQAPKYFEVKYPRGRVGLKDVPGKPTRTKLSSKEQQQSPTDTKRNCKRIRSTAEVSESKLGRENKARLSVKKNEQNTSNVPVTHEPVQKLFLNTRSSGNYPGWGNLIKLNVQELMIKYSIHRETPTIHRKVEMKREKVCTLYY